MFKAYDVLLMPAAPEPAPRKEDVDGGARMRGMAFTQVGTAAGLPATIFPIGLTRSWLPVSAQAVGPYLADRAVIRFAALVQQQFGGYHRPAGYSSVV